MTSRALCLVICHRSAVEAAVAAANRHWPELEIELLPYGRLSDEVPAPPETRIVSMPVLTAGGARGVLSALRWLVDLRRRGYAVAAIAQPNLGLNRARGLLVAFARSVGARTTVLVDPVEQRVRRDVRWDSAVLDAGRWALLYAGCRAIAAGGGRALGWAAAQATPDRRPIPTAGTVLYLRSDVELALAPLETGGSLAHTDGVLRALLRRGHRVVLLTTGTMAGLPAAAEERRLPVVLRGNVPIEMAELLSGLLQGLRPSRRPADLAFVYQRYSLNNLAGLLLARRWRVPLVLEANASEVKWREDWGSLQLGTLARATERLLLRSAARVAVVSENAGRDLLAAGAPAETVVVVANAVEVDRFAGASPQPLPFPDDAFVIGFAGLFYPWHGVRHLAAAFVELHRRRPEARLLLAGDGEEAALVRSILADGDALQAAYLPGLVPRDDVPGLLAACDVLVSPHADIDDFIGSPIKIFEYLASGRAIVASRVAQLAEVLADGETALLVDPEDPAALAAALERLLDDEPLRRRLARAARQDAVSRHSWDARLEALLSNRTPAV